MRVIWTLGKSDAQEVTALLSESKDWKTATVKTLLGRLVKKAYCGQKPKEKNLFIILWFPRMLRFKVPQSLFSHICAKIGQTLAEMIRESELTNEDLTMLEEALAQKNR